MVVHPAVAAGGRHPACDPDWISDVYAEYGTPRRAQALDRLRGLLQDGQPVTPEDFLFAAQGAYCGEVCSVLGDELDCEVHSGYWRPAGWRGGFHVWLELPDGTLVDPTHSQFRPEHPVLVAALGSREAEQFVTWQQMVAENNRAAFDIVEGPVDDTEWARLRAEHA